MPLADQALGRTDVIVAAGVWLVALAVLVAGATLAGLDPGTASSFPALGSTAWWVGAIAVTLQAGALLVRRRLPGPVLLAVAAIAVLPPLAGAGETGNATSVAVLVAAYTLAAGGALRGGLPALVAAATLVSLATFLALPDDALTGAAAIGTAAVQGLLVVGAGAVTGVVVGTRRDAAEARARQAEAVSREHGARVEAAVARERAEMARELHDIAAHHLSGIAVMAGAIGRQIDVDPQAAKAGMERVRAETSALLDELRGLVRLLRDPPPPDDDGEPAVESLGSIAALVDRMQAAGFDARLTLLGIDADLPVASVGPLAQLAVHRTVREALANVVRHAPGGRCEVVLDGREPARLVVSVRNGPPPHSPGSDARTADGGLGLVGMQERADLTDAHLTYGPQPDGGWQVTLALPTHPSEAPAERTPA